MKKILLLILLIPCFTSAGDLTSEPVQNTLAPVMGFIPLKCRISGSKCTNAVAHRDVPIQHMCIKILGKGYEMKGFMRASDPYIFLLCGRGEEL